MLTALAPGPAGRGSGLCRAVIAHDRRVLGRHFSVPCGPTRRSPGQRSGTFSARGVRYMRPIFIVWSDPPQPEYPAWSPDPKDSRHIAVEDEPWVLVAYTLTSS
jgi:hypothetical protein